MDQVWGGIGRHGRVDDEVAIRIGNGKVKAVRGLCIGEDDSQGQILTLCQCDTKRSPTVPVIRERGRHVGVRACPARLSDSIGPEERDIVDVGQGEGVGARGGREEVASVVEGEELAGCRLCRAVDVEVAAAATVQVTRRVDSAVIDVVAAAAVCAFHVGWVEVRIVSQGVSSFGVVEHAVLQPSVAAHGWSRACSHRDGRGSSVRYSLRRCRGGSSD